MKEFIMLYFGMGFVGCVAYAVFFAKNKAEFVKDIENFRSEGGFIMNILGLFLMVLVGWLPILIVTLLRPDKDEQNQTSK